MLQVQVKHKKFNVYAFDIETHNDEESIAKRETSMWLGCLIDDELTIDDEDSYYYNMQQVIQKLNDLAHAKRKNRHENRPCKNILIYIYNASFEWSFMLPELLKYGFVHKLDAKDDNDLFYFESTTTRSVSSVWQVNLHFGAKSGDVIIRDISKIFAGAGSLRSLAKSFDLPTQKGDIDYRLNRLHGHVVTKEEKQYCWKDTRIIIDIVKEMVDRGDKDFFNCVSAGSYSMRKLIKCGYGGYYKPMKQFRKDYPLVDEEETEFVRTSVAGGITYANDVWQFKDIKHKIMHIDAHQMHPTQCYFHRFPYGKGRYFTGEPKYAGNITSCCHIRVSYSGVWLHSIIQLIGITMVNDYELYVWDFEIPTMKKCYEDLEIEYIDGYEYTTKPFKWRKYYKDNYIKRLDAKKRGDAFGVLYYKLLNNSSYGKLLEHGHNVTYKNIVDEFGLITSNVIEKENKDINAKYTYIPAGSCIPAYSRVCLIETALKFDSSGRKICYFDTDSIFIMYDKETERVWQTLNHSDFLGGWALEEMIDRAQFTAPKRYKTLVNGETNVKMAGINFNDYIKTQISESTGKKYNDVTNDEIDKYMIDYDEIDIVESEYKVNRAYRVKGGTIIDLQPKDISVQQKYEDIAKKNLK